MIRKRPFICEDVAKMLTLARSQRSDQEVNAERMRDAFGITKDGLTLGDLDDWQLLQALFIETQWALAQQGREMQVLSSVAGLNRAERRKVAHAARR